MSGLYLSHHGIKGQKWGIRRFQNKDGSLTNLGKKRRNVKTTSPNDLENMIRKELRKMKMGEAYVKHHSADKITDQIDEQNFQIQNQIHQQFTQQLLNSPATNPWMFGF